MPILGSESYPAIRAIIDTSLDSAVLPDDVIALPIYLDDADLETKARDPGWASRTGDALTRLRTAAMCLTAARILPALPQIKSEQHGGEYQYQRQEVKVAERVAELRARADAALAAILEPTDTTPAMPTLFALGRGRRGR